ncbi:S-layer homology domain-containing protein [Oscillibacter sp. MSJ-2]|uniref:S-layer homology domain-containing protein n=1 Tax=Dysosmobacter acutus TaxID=2841504 RepID=A0ABS6FAP8_9FIRM|nr:S-layer homology domain-containing protein [Dysosmobacter acutus]MBU5626726.1 S-layer homology domain-containing protein [Dysosmobacter acutus]
MKKRIGSLLLILALCFTLLPTAALAAENSAATWNGTADTSWYTDHETDTEYRFTTAEQLAGLAQLVNDKTASVSFKGKTIYLDNDLDLSGSQWTPIGDGSNQGRFFAGTFDGQHHKIMNLHHHSTGDELIRNGLFGVVSDGGTLKNLLVIDADIASNDGSLLAGILADWVNGGTVENCYTSGRIENNVGDKMVGGLIGQCTWSTQVKGCGSDAAVVSTEGSFEHADTVGGLIGQWENSSGNSSITDCWFGGSVSCDNIYSAVGGILGANFDFYGEPGVTIRNCLVATKDITSKEPGNVTWIAAVATPRITNCIWPDTPPDGVTLDEETYPDNKGNYLAVVKLVVDLNAGTAGADPTFDQSSCGTAESNFTSTDVLTGLQDHAGAGIGWVAGIKHPTFAWDDNNILADYTAVDAAIAAAKAIDSNLYSNYADVEKAIYAVDRTKSKAEQAEVDAMAQAIEDAINALVRRSSGGDDSDPTYAIEVGEDIRNGTVTANRRYAERGDTVTITVKPDDGFKLDDLTVTDKNGNELKLTDKGNGKYTFKMPAGKVTVSATFAPEKTAADYFADVPANSYYADAVLWAAKNGITGGIGNGLFGPNQPCTRAQIVTFLWRAAGSPVVNYAMNMTDVAEDAYYAEAVRWALSEGITTGTGDGKFSPDTTCTRAQSVTFLFRAIGKLVDSKAEFSDVLTDSYYANAVAWAVENGVTNGIGNGLFGPDNSCTRAQIVTFLFRAYQGK